MALFFMNTGKKSMKLIRIKSSRLRIVCLKYNVERTGRDCEKGFSNASVILIV